MRPALSHRSAPLARQTVRDVKKTGRSSSVNDGAVNDNDGTCRKALWKRLEGDSWEAFDALPRSIRLRLTEHVYDAWSVNTLALWQHYKRVHGANERAERALIRYLDYCERLEQQAFAERHGALPHQAAGATPLRYGFIGQD